MIEIEKGIPIPSRFHLTSFANLYPLHEMDVDDSFFVKDGNIRNLSQYVCKFAKKQSDGKKFSVRRVEDGVRVWRIK